MHPALRRFIEQGERELDELDEPERTIHAAKLHNEMLRRFKPEMFTGDEEFDGKHIDDEPITQKDVEDTIIEDYWDKTEDVAEDECYNDGEGDGDSERGPRLPKMKPNPLIKHATTGEVKSWDGRLREEQIPTRLNSGIIERAPDAELLPNMVAAPEQTDLVGMGEIFFADKDYDGCSEYKSQRPYHDRVSRLMFNVQTRAQSRRKRGTECVCQHCGEEFHARKGTKYCSANCRKRAHDDSQIVSR